MIEFSQIDKSFGGVRVLRGVSFSVPPGHTLGLVGENGAGKSTLMNILGGNLQPDAGSMRLNQQPYTPRHATDAARRGVAFIHQELNLFPNLSVAENIFLTAFPKTAGLPFIQRRALRARATALLQQVGFDVSPDTLVEQLSPGQRQLVEIAKALSIDARLILFDEPTTSLSAWEAENLFALIQRLRQRDRSMIYISHTLGDVLRLCDHVVVLRDGEVVGQGAAADFTTDQMVSLMVGRHLTQLYPTRRARPTAKPVLEVIGLTQPPTLRDIRFTLYRGEILGLAGLMGAGRSELARVLFGLDPFARGRILLEGKPIEALAPRARIQQGLAFLTEDRRAEGLCLEATIADNIALVSLPRYAHTPLQLIDPENWRTAVAAMREAVRLTSSAGDGQTVATLSGGNQQKVVLAKWLLVRPRVLILDEPTRGIDVRARFEVHQLIQQRADEGASALVISSEIDELTGLCDRILVMRRGEIADVLPRAEFDRERILRSALPPAHERAIPSVPPA